MKLLICEFITAGGLNNEALPAGLLAEGELMVQALLSDLAECAGIVTTCLRDRRLQALPEPGTSCYLSAELSLHEWLSAHARGFDAVWLIAPETDGIQAGLVELLESLNVRQLGCDSSAVRLCTDKTQTLEVLVRCGLPCVAVFKDPDDALKTPGPWVVKPVDGAGCERSYVCQSAQTLQSTVETFPTANYFISPWLEGQAMSLSVMVQAGEPRLLCINRQSISTDEGVIVLKALEVNVMSDQLQFYDSLAQAVYAAIPGLDVYFGIDFILTDAGPVILELNPRLTSSYAGIRRATGINLAACMLAQNQSLRSDRVAQDAITITL